MSFLDSSSSGNNKPEQFINPKRWEDFVQLVLEITVQGYQNFYQKRLAKSNWEEDQFTINLENFVRPLAFQKGIFVVSQIKNYTPEMETGNVSVKKAKVLDLRMWGLWEENYHKVHFVWECKRIAEAHENKDYKDLVPEYISEGMFRFLDEEYSLGLNDAGILGYVLHGDVQNIVNAINKSMQSARRKRPLDISDHLHSVSPIDTFSNVYQSCHERLLSTNKIKLYHLFFPFDFAKTEQPIHSL